MDDRDTFELIPKAVSERENKQLGNNTGTENILRCKVICGCFGGKFQRRYCRNREWAFGSCITNNYLGIEKCTGSIRTSAGSEKLGEEIKKRRNELGLTIEAAAEKSGVGTKTWSRYEAGGSIRSDKVSGICKALKWNALPDSDLDEDTFDINEYKKRESWSDDLAKTFGLGTAVSFVIGYSV